MPRSLPARPLGLVLLASAALVLAACTPEPTPTAAPTSAAPSASPEASAAPIVLVPDATAAENLPFFASIVDTVAAGPDSVTGRAYIDALVAGGFDKAAMQVTADQTTVGNAAESIMFAVRWGDDCLVGQVGPATGAPVAIVLPGLESGGCLVGQTRAIDW